MTVSLVCWAALPVTAHLAKISKANAICHLPNGAGHCWRDRDASTTRFADA